MVILMAIIVTPLGVVAAVYLHEYAGKNSLTKIIRIAVINLAGCPPSSTACSVWASSSTPWGQHRPPLLPGSAAEPDLRLPGVIWSALTLAILTLPVVIVSTEEGLAGSRAPFARVRWRWVPPRPRPCGASCCPWPARPS
jgi:phosphate transport system permease protein